MSQEKSADVINLQAGRAAPARPDDKAGELLREARERQGLTHDQIFADTKVKVEHLEAIEATRPDKLPALPYAIGFVKTYARRLGLDADEIAAQFKSDVLGNEPTPLDSVRPAEPVVAPEAMSEGVKLGSLAAIAIILLFALWIGFQVIGAGGGADEAENATGAVLSETAAPRPSPRTISAAPEEAAPVEEMQSLETSATDQPEIPAVIDNAEIDAAADGAETEALIEPIETTPPPRTEATAPPEEIIPDDATIFPSRLIERVEPAYPETCADAGAVETVSLVYDVTAAGGVANVRILSSSNGCFNLAAINAVSQWRFNPRSVDGAPRPDLGKTSTVTFRR